MKRKRKRKQGLMVGGFVTVALLFLGFASVKFLWNRQEIAKNAEADAGDPSATKSVSKPKETTPKPIGGKNAPKPTGGDNAFVLPTLSKEEPSGEVNMVGADENLPGGLPAMPGLPNNPPTPAMNPAPMNPAPMNPAPMNPAPMNPAPMNPAENAPPMGPANLGVSKADWVAAMVKGREALNKADFPTFHKQMELALPLSSNDELIAKHARLDQLGQLYEIFIKAAREARSKMRGAETLSVGKTLVSIVEVTENELIVRNQGKNERFAWDRLPPGIAMAIADLTLSDSEPTDLAARGVYFSLSPSRNNLSAKKVTEWFDKSVGKGPIRKDLVQALTDTYE